MGVNTAPYLVRRPRTVTVITPSTKRVGIEVWQHTPDRSNPIQRKVIEHLEAAGYQVVDVRTAIAHDLPILSFLATQTTLSAALTDITNNQPGRRRGCAWRVQHGLSEGATIPRESMVRMSEVAVRICDEFLKTRSLAPIS